MSIAKQTVGNGEGISAAGPPPSHVFGVCATTCRYRPRKEIENNSEIKEHNLDIRQRYSNVLPQKVCKRQVNLRISPKRVWNAHYQHIYFAVDKGLP